MWFHDLWSRSSQELKKMGLFHSDLSPHHLHLENIHLKIKVREAEKREMEKNIYYIV